MMPGSVLPEHGGKNVYNINEGNDKEFSVKLKDRK